MRMNKFCKTTTQIVQTMNEMITNIVPFVNKMTTMTVITMDGQACIACVWESLE